ncbi:MAG: Stp1/IreP family PP2C-type Ser/Thr phosphatase [Clostridia bacterium]|nr:Stp1/IreP family PP2C-type Ser/Thr phosphatase [Clostridia bacterium]
MILAAKTDMGRVRENNQDSYSLGELTNGACYAIICDGMGGASEGKLASGECVRIVRERIKSGYYEGMSDLSVKSLLFTAVEYANKYIFQLSQSDEKYRGMGTTIVAAVITADFVYAVHAGDSRAYLLNPQKGEIIQLTRDHSVVQRMVEDGTITAEEAVVHPKKNLITRAVGVDSEVRTDFCQEDLISGDIVLLCTDGLSNYVSVSDLVHLAQDYPVEEYVGKLIETAMNNGGRDNVTAVAVSV